jgi:hypothetical protein
MQDLLSYIKIKLKMDYVRKIKKGKEVKNI